MSWLQMRLRIRAGIAETVRHVLSGLCGRSPPYDLSEEFILLLWKVSCFRPLDLGIGELQYSVKIRRACRIPFQYHAANEQVALMSTFVVECQSRSLKQEALVFASFHHGTNSTTIWKSSWVSSATPRRIIMKCCDGELEKGGTEPSNM